MKILLMSIAIVSSSVAFAQRVETALVDGNPVINCEGMRIGSYDTTPKGSTKEELRTEKANKTLYKRFAVHKNNNGGKLSWSNAFTACNSGWRLPTQRELMLMWILSPELAKKSGFIELGSLYYWSATGDNPTGWTVFFTSGTTFLRDGQITSDVRCIKEL